MNNSLFFLLERFAFKNNVKLDKVEAKVQLLSHPHFPSLNSITDLFNHFKIDNVALKVNTNLEVFSQIPPVFLAQVEINKKSYLVVVTKKGKEVEMIFNEKKKRSKTVEEFLEDWTGILFLIEKPTIKETTPINKNDLLKRSIAILVSIAFLSTFVVSKPSIFQFTHFILSCIGIYISYLITQHELGLNSKILDKFCSSNNKKTNCDAVLSSKGATILNLFKLSDAGLVYFSTITISWIIISLGSFQNDSVYFLLSTMAIPLTIISIFYQKVIVKSWCPLCLTIVGLLWLQFASLFLVNSFWETKYSVDSSYIIFLLGILVSIALWMCIKPLLIKEQKFEKIKIEHLKFKRNFKLFKAALNLRQKININTSIPNEIVFGSKNDANALKIMIVTNPMCGYCKESHAIVEEILQQENTAIQITIRFNVQADNKESIGTKISAKIIELYHTANEKKCLQSLSDIYGNINAENWLRKWGEASKDDYYKTLKNEKEWCAIHKINFTPAMLINGQQYPKEYDRKDLLYFLDDLIDEKAEIELGNS